MSDANMKHETKYDPEPFDGDDLPPAWMPIREI